MTNRRVRAETDRREGEDKKYIAALSELKRVAGLETFEGCKSCAHVHEAEELLLFEAAIFGCFDMSLCGGRNGLAGDLLSW